MTLRLDMLDKEERRALYQELSNEFSRPRALTPGLKETKLKAATGVLNLISDFTTPQQRQILKFCERMIEDANNQFWRDNAYQAPKKTKQARS